MAKGKKGKKNARQDDSDDEFPDITKDPSLAAPAEEAAEEETSSAAKNTKKSKKGKKAPPRGAVRVMKDEESEDDAMAKMAAEMKLEEDKVSEPSPQVSKKNKKKGKKGKPVQVNSESEDELVKMQKQMEKDEEEKDAAAAEAKAKKSSKGKKSNKFAMMDDSEEENISESDDSAPAPATKSKFAGLMSDSEDDKSAKSEEEEKPKKKPKKSKKKDAEEGEDGEKKKKKKKKKKDDDGDEDKDEEKPKKKKKTKKSKADFLNDDENDDNEENKVKSPENDSETAKEIKPKKEKKPKRAKKPSMLDEILNSNSVSEVSEAQPPKSANSNKSKPNFNKDSEDEGDTNEKSSKESDQQELVQQFCHDDDVPVAIDPNAWRELTEEEVTTLSKKDRRKYLKKLEDFKEEKEAERVADVAIGTSSLGNFTVSQPRDATSKDTQQDLSDDIKIENFSISAKGNCLYDNAELRIIHGRKYGIIGPNGKGKTTLLRCIGAKLLKIPKHIDLLYCEQEVQADDTPAIEAVLNSDKIRVKYLKREKELLAAQEAGEKIDQDELKQLYDDMKAHGVDQAEPRARRILAGLQFTIAMQKQPTNAFSGGWRMRVSLARALFLEPTLLMLDEPTNHLDLNAVIWLNNYLMEWKKTLIIVSHDQQFLDDVCTDVVHLDQKKLNYYKGNYTDWKAQYQIYIRSRMQQYNKQEKRLKELKVRGTKAKAEKAVKEALTRKQEKNRSQKKRQDMMQDNAETAVELIAKPREYEVDFTFPNPPQLNPPVLGLYDVSFGYPGQPLLFENVEFGVDMDSRISIVGPNGVGKSTLLKLLLGEIEPTTGECRRNHRLRTAYYSQHSAEYLPLEVSPVDYLKNKFDPDCDYQKARKYLGNTGLDGKAHTIPNKDLSGGQKARVALADLILSCPDILIFDEPTNNLDIESIDALADAINAYSGGVVIVSHDARLITATNCQLWVVGNKNCVDSKGDFEDYKQTIMDELEEMLEKNS